MHQLITTSRLMCMKMKYSVCVVSFSVQLTLLLKAIYSFWVFLEGYMHLLLYRFLLFVDHCSDYFFPFFRFIASKGKALKEEWISYICHEVLNVSVPLCCMLHLSSFLETCYTQFLFLFSFLGRVWVIFIKITSYIEISRDRMCCWLMGQKLSLVRTSETVS